MACDPIIFDGIPFFSLLDAEERAVLAEYVSLRRFPSGARIYRVGDMGDTSFIVLNGKVHLVVIDQDNQEVVTDTPGAGEMFGLASMLSASPRQTTAIAQEETFAIEVDRTAIAELLKRKPLAGLDLMTMVGRQFRAAQDLVRMRAARSPNEIIDEQLGIGDRLADSVARFGGSWWFIGTFAVVLLGYAGINIALKGRAWDPYPFILLNLFLSMLAAVQAPVIMMSQNRQDAKDRVRSELDFAVNRKAEMEITQIAGKLNQIDDRLYDLERALTKSAD